ncbi:hypothetical protein AtubIFM54640_010130 [Aspergillus tubingensis]|nr:hypothetical protein AtubIFM54640_010130 [Aspergillus tubingensis]
MSTRASTLPPLSPAEFKLFNRMADTMQSLHQHFEVRWNVMYEVAKLGTRPPGMSIKNYLNLCQEFCQNLEKHHQIEETFVFPSLAKRMPAFANEDALINQHRVIHNGLENLQSYVQSCLDGRVELRWNEVKDILDSFGATLMDHLKEEVRQLGAEETRKYWTAQEMTRMPM